MCVGRAIAICCRFMLVIILLTGMILSILAVSSCDFMKAVYEVPNNILGGNATSTTGTVSMDATLGLWRYESTEGCSPYVNNNNNNKNNNNKNNPASTSTFHHDRSEVVAQKSGVAAPILAFCAICFIVLELCCCRKCGGSGIPCLKFFIALLLTSTEICQGLTFMFLNSHQFCNGNAVTSILKHHCEISQGGSYSASAVALYVLASALLSCTPSLGSGNTNKEKENDKTFKKGSAISDDHNNNDDDDDDIDFEQASPQGKTPGTMA